MSTANIIVISDNSIYLELIKELLIEEGHPPARCCVHGSAVFDLVQREQPSLVLLDISIGHSGEGWSILGLLGMHPATTHIPVILCSSDLRPLHENVAWLADMRCARLEKPFALDALRGEVRAILGRPP